MIGYCQPYSNGTHSLHFTYDEALTFAKDKLPNDLIGPYKCPLSREEALNVQKTGSYIKEGLPPNRIWE